MASSKSQEDARATPSPLERLNKNAAELIYHDLKPNEFRFVHLQPGTDGVVECTLFNQFLYEKALGETSDEEASTPSEEEYSDGEEDFSDENGVENVERVDEEIYGSEQEDPGHGNLSQSDKVSKISDDRNYSDTTSSGNGANTEDDLRNVEYSPAAEELGRLDVAEIKYWGDQEDGEEVRYEALSYVWGSQDNPPAILLDDFEYHVTRNLLLALQHLRSASTVQTLWIDAICIDQTDTIEKNVQVRLMHRLYSQADQVIAWLGLADENSSHIMAAARQEYDKWHWLHCPDALRISMSLSRFLSRDYWARPWVVQEVAWARDVILMCSFDTLEVSALVDFQDKCSTLKSQIALGAALRAFGRSSELNFFLNSCAAGPRAMNLGFPGRVFDSQDLQDLRDKKCADPRDRVYGCYSLFPPPVQSLLEIDYTSPIAEVFTNATKAFMIGARWLDIISWPKRSESTINGSYHSSLPSWVPDWGTVNHCRPFVYWFALEATLHIADPVLLPGNVLRLSGKSIAIIQSVHLCPSLEWEGRASTEEETNALWLDLISLWQSISLDDDSIETFSGQLASSVRRFSTQPPESFHTTYLDSVRRLESTTEDFQPPNVHLPTEVTSWLSGLRDDIRYRAFSRGQDEDGQLMIILSSNAVKTGDMLCILLGCSVPLILRPGPENSYDLISDGYNPGFFSNGTDRLFDFEDLGIDLDDLGTFDLV